MLQAAALPSSELSAHGEHRAHGEHGETIASWAELFGLFSDRTRLQILYHLSRNEELNVGALCDLIGQSQPAVSHHLSRLRDAGVLTARREGKLRHYRLVPHRYRDVLDAAFAEVNLAEPAAAL